MLLQENIWIWTGLPPVGRILMIAGIVFLQRYVWSVLRPLFELKTGYLKFCGRHVKRFRSSATSRMLGRCGRSLRFMWPIVNIVSRKQRATRILHSLS